MTPVSYIEWIGVIATGVAIGKAVWCAFVVVCDELGKRRA